MGKSKRSRRDNNTIAKRSLPQTLTPFDAARQLDFFRDLKPIEDRRTWHPEGKARPARSFDSSRHRLVVGQAQVKQAVRTGYTKLRHLALQVPKAVAFQAPEKVLVCVRRQMRREVMHALKKAGKRGQKSRRWSWYSNISCKRRK